MAIGMFEVNGEVFWEDVGVDEARKILWEKPKSEELAQRVLFVMTGLCAILSLIPPLRFGASLALRGISMLSVSAAKTSPTKPGLLLHLAKVSAVALGTIGLAVSLAPLMIASLGVDLGAQFIQAIQAFANEDPMKGLLHILLFIIDTFVFVGMILGSWQLMVVATVIGAFAIFLPFAVSCIQGKADRSVVFIALVAVSFLGMGTSPLVGPAFAGIEESTRNDRELLI